MRTLRTETLPIETSKGEMEIPIKLKSAKNKNNLGFVNINPETGNRVRRAWKDEETGEIVDTYAKGFELNDEIHEFSSKEELDKLRKVTGTQGIEFKGVMSKDEFLGQYHNGHYYIAPEEDGEKKYAFLKEMLRQSNSVLVIEYAYTHRPSLYGLYWNDHRGVIEAKKFYYPEEVEEPDFSIGSELGEDQKEKARKLVEKVREEKSDEELVDKYNQILEEKVEQVIIEGQDLDVETEEEQKETQELEEELETVI